MSFQIEDIPSSYDCHIPIDLMNSPLTYSLNGAYKYPDKNDSWDKMVQRRRNYYGFEPSNELQKNYYDTMSNIGMHFINQNYNWNQTQYPYASSFHQNDYHANNFLSFNNTKTTTEFTISHEPFCNGGDNWYQSNNFFGNMHDSNQYQKADKIQYFDDKNIPDVSQKQQHFCSGVMPPLLQCNDNPINDMQMKKDKQQKKRCKRKYTTGYGLFFRKQYREIQKINPGIDFGTISKNIASTWRNMGYKDRKKYLEQVEKQPYSTNYGRFFHEKYKKIKSMNVDTSFGEVSKILSRMWVNLSPKEKKAYRPKISQISASIKKTNICK